MVHAYVGKNDACQINWKAIIDHTLLIVMLVSTGVTHLMS